jgi:hypothetical protein
MVAAAGARVLFVVCVAVILIAAARPWRVFVSSEPFQYKKICVVTNGSDHMFLQSMVWHLVAQKRRNDFDEWIIFKTRNDANDDRYLDIVRGIHHWITVEDRNVQADRSLDIARSTTRADTIYVKLDQNVVWLEDGFVRKLVEARIGNPEPFLVMPNIVNHGYVAFIYKRNGVFDAPLGYDDLEPETAKRMHETFLADLEKNSISKWKRAFDQYVKEDTGAVSLPAVAYFGADFADFVIDDGVDVDEYLTSVVPQRKERRVLFVGSPLCVNYSANDRQLAALNGTDIHKRYIASMYANI